VPKSAELANDSNLITSRDNKWLKQFRTILRGKGPTGDEPLGVESPKLIEEALRAGLRTEALLVSEVGERDLLRILTAAGESDAGISQSRVLRTSDKLFESVSSTETPQGSAALFRQPAWSMEDVLGGHGEQPSEPLVVVLAAVQDPGNVGTILRSAEAFGATGIVAISGTADPWSPKAIRASAASALRVPLLRGIQLPVLLAQLKINHVKIIAASSHHDGGAAVGSPKDDTKSRPKTSTEKVLREPVALFIGNEGAGLPPEVERIADAHISIPMTAAVESLNAGVAASVLLYEAFKQRHPH
jgi:TrmH family RNA methyltransferase